MKESAALIVGLLLAVLPAGGLLEANDFDHRYTTYGEVLTRYVRMPRVDYAAWEKWSADARAAYLVDLKPTEGLPGDLDMGAVMAMRAEYKDAFEKKHGVRLGFMSSFIRAACIALKEWPAVNGEIYGDEIIYKNYYNIGVAVGSPKGLVVPVLKDADKMGFADIEGGISDTDERRHKA